MNTLFFPYSVAGSSPVAGGSPRTESSWDRMMLVRGGSPATIGDYLSQAPLPLAQYSCLVTTPTAGLTLLSTICPKSVKHLPEVSLKQSA